MKRILLLCAASFSLGLFGCSSIEPTPTTISTIVAQTTPNPIATPVLPTITKITTLIPTSTTATGTPTATRTLRPPTPQPTATPTPGSSPTLPPPSGSIIFLWDPNRYTDLGLVDTVNNLYVALPGETAVEWQVETLLESLHGKPSIALSPDQMRLAVTIVEDSNGSGSIDTRTDSANLFVYDLGTSDLTRLTDDYQIGKPHWIPNTDSVSFARFGQVFSIDVNNLTIETLIAQLPDGVDHLSWSPDGALLAIELQTGLLLLYDVTADELLYLDDITLGKSWVTLWSPNSEWVLSNGTSSTGLIVVNVATQEVLKLVDAGHLLSATWSPDSQYLAYSQSQRNDVTDIYNTSILLWNTETQSSRQIITEIQASGLVLMWSPDGTQLVMEHFADEGQTLIFSLIDINTGQLTTLWQSSFFADSSSSVYPISWSPDGQWLLFFAQEAGKTGLSEIFNAGVYIVHRSGGEPILLLNTANEQTQTFHPYGFYWLSQELFVPSNNE